MKKITICILALLILGMVSCSNRPYTISGLDEYHPADSSMGITKHFFPTEDSSFLTLFEYADGDYHYYYSGDVHEKAIATLKYDEGVYKVAKQYCIDNMYLSTTNIKEHNGYIFVENLAYAEAYDHLKNNKNTEFPKFFTMFGYNDSLNTLVFIGFCAKDAYSDKDDPKDAYAETDFGKFLDIFFSEYYDFNAK